MISMEQQLDQGSDQKQVVFLVRDIPVQIRNDFKSICAKEGRTMNDAFLDFLQKVVQDGDLSSVG